MHVEWKLKSMEKLILRISGQINKNTDDLERTEVNFNGMVIHKADTFLFFKFFNALQAIAAGIETKNIP